MQTKHSLQWVLRVLTCIASSVHYFTFWKKALLEIEVNHTRELASNLRKEVFSVIQRQAHCRSTGTKGSGCKSGRAIFNIWIGPLAFDNGIKMCLPSGVNLIRFLEGWGVVGSSIVRFPEFGGVLLVNGIGMLMICSMVVVYFYLEMSESWVVISWCVTLKLVFSIRVRKKE